MEKVIIISIFKHNRGCLFTWLLMPVYTVADTCYTPITGITYCRTRHLQQSWKASERVLEGIVINIPPILQSRDGKHKQMVTWLQL